MKNLEKKITELVKKGYISSDLPKMGGTLTVLAGNETFYFDLREYYEGRGAKYNKNINHEAVKVKVTVKAINDCIRVIKLRKKVAKMRNKAFLKGKQKGNNSDSQYYLKNYKTDEQKMIFPKIKEIKREKI